MSKILVLLSTYNGEKYICEQLDSLIEQTGVDVTILVRDDGSSDNTPDYLIKYQSKFPDKIIVDLAENRGCTASFMALMKLAVEKYGDYDYYAFSDQDDVWLPDKLQTAASALNKVKNHFKLYYCSPQLVDSHLNPIESAPLISKRTLEEAFILQPCIGCSMVFSKELLKEAAIIDPSKIDIHDAWTYKVALALGGDIIFDSTPHILYRQHSSNVIGRSQGFRRKWERRLKNFFSTYRFRSGQAQLILTTYAGKIPESKRKILSTIGNYHNSSLQKLKIIFSGKYSSNYRIYNIMFNTAILFGKI